MCHQGTSELPSEGETAEILVPTEDGQTLPTLVARPSGSGAGVVVVTDIYGQSPFYAAIAQRLAAEGFVAAVPDIFFRQGPLEESTFPAAARRRGSLDERLTLRDLAGLVGHLRADDQVSGPRVGTIGFCMGGTLALDLTTVTDEVATISCYGFPVHVGPPRSLAAPAPLDVVADLRGPILALWGDGDESVGVDNVHRFLQATDEHDLELESHLYEGVGHGFLAGLDHEPGTPTREAADDAWARVLAFLRRHTSSAEPVTGEGSSAETAHQTGDV